MIELPDSDQRTGRLSRRRRAVLAGTAATLVVVLAIVVVVRSDEPRVRVRAAGEPNTSSSTDPTTFAPSTTRPGDTAHDLSGAANASAGPRSPWSVGPTTGLGNFDTMLFSGTGLPADVYLVGQCPAARARAGDLGACHYHDVTVGADGHFASSLIVTWRVGNVDCGAAPGTCLVGVMSSNPRAPWKPVVWDIAFDAARRPRIEVSPSTGLVEGQTVEVRGYNLGAASISLYEACARTPSCGAAVETSTGSDGSFRAALTVQYAFEYFSRSMVFEPGVCDDESCSVYVAATYAGKADFGSRWDSDVGLRFAAVPPTTAPAPTDPSTSVPTTVPSSTSTSTTTSIAG